MAVEWRGIRELLGDFERLEQIETPVGRLIERTAQRVLTETSVAYPHESLRRGLRLRQMGPTWWRVQQTAPHGHLYELGTGDRFTASGAARGRMPARPTLIRIAAERREQMERDFGELLRGTRGHGLGLVQLDTRGV